MHRGGFVGKLDSFGIIRIGYHEADAVDIYSSHTIIDVRPGGYISLDGDIHIGHGAIICVKDGALLSLGKNFAISGTTKIVCSKKISFGDNVQLSWDSLVMDSDAHHIIDENGIKRDNSQPVIIGNSVWIAAGCTILKGTIIPDNCVVGAGSLVIGKDFLPNQVIAGHPAKCIKKISSWEL